MVRDNHQQSKARQLRGILDAIDQGTFSDPHFTEYDRPRSPLDIALGVVPPGLPDEPDAAEVARVVVGRLWDRIPDQQQLAAAAARELDAWSSLGRHPAPYGAWAIETTKAIRTERAERFRDRYWAHRPEREREQLVNGLLAPREAALVGGPLKTCKSCIAADVVAGLVTGTPIVDMVVPRSCRAVIVTAENSPDEYRRRLQISAAARRPGTSEDEISELIEASVFITDNLDLVWTSAGRRELADFMNDFEAEVVLFDPLYRCLPAKDAANLLSVGKAMGAICQPIVDAGGTPIVVHHFGKHVALAEEPRLEDLSGAGVAEYVRAWMLVNRLTKYSFDQVHELKLVWGNCHGEAGFKDVRLDERDGRLAERPKPRKSQRGL